MNVQEYNLMNCIMDQTYVNQRILSEITGYSLGKVNSSLKKLTELGYIDEKMQCTSKAYEELKEKMSNGQRMMADDLFDRNRSYKKILDIIKEGV